MYQRPYFSIASVRQACGAQALQLAPGLRVVGFGGSVPALYEDGKQAWEGFPYTEADIAEGVARALQAPPVAYPFIPRFVDGFGPGSIGTLPSIDLCLPTLSGLEPAHAGAVVVCLSLPSTLCTCKLARLLSQAN